MDNGAHEAAVIHEATLRRILMDNLGKMQQESQVQGGEGFKACQKV